MHSNLASVPRPSLHLSVFPPLRAPSFRHCIDFTRFSNAQRLALTPTTLRHTLTLKLCGVRTSSPVSARSDITTGRARSIWGRRGKMRQG